MLVSPINLTAPPSVPRKCRFTSPQSSDPGLSHYLVNDVPSGVEHLGLSPYVSRADGSDLYSNTSADGWRSWVAQDGFVLSNHQSQTHSAAVIKSHGHAAYGSGGHLIPKSLHHGSRQPIDPGVGCAINTFAALGYQSDSQYTEPTDDMFSRCSAVASSISLSEAYDHSPNLDRATTPYAPLQSRVKHLRHRTGSNTNSMRPLRNGVDILEGSSPPSYDRNLHSQADGWASPTANLVDHTSSERLQTDNPCYPRIGPAVRHSHYGLHHVADITDLDLMGEHPSQMVADQRWARTLAAKMPLEDTPPHLFARTPPRGHSPLLPLLVIDRTFLSPSYSSLPLSGSNPREPVQSLTKTFSSSIVPRKRSIPATSTDSLSTLSPSITSPGSVKSYGSMDSVEVCPHCCFVSRGKKRSDRKSNLKRHIRDKHTRTEEARPMCPEINCGKTFERSDYVLRH